MSKDILEIRWHGRGGQGAITAAKIVAKAAFDAGQRGVVMAPTFGTERRGAPVHTALKISKSKINDICPIENPDIVIVLDDMILDEVDVTAGLKNGGTLILNTAKPKEKFPFENIKVITVNVTDLAEKAGLKRGIVNSGIIGALAKAFPVAPLDRLLEEIETEFKGKHGDKNAEAARLTYEHTELE